ncbi:MAG: acetate kinase, partial [Deinococcota bacterium]|nr:acetate kinase [Deinococcota bacterium]
FHATLPPQAYLYGLPRRFCGEGLRRYGFHGASHDFVTRAAARVLGRPRQELKLISLHLGNGASAAAVAHGRSVDTTMGLTPLEGLLMGTRPGDIDPGVLLYLLREGMSLA